MDPRVEQLRDPAHRRALLRAAMFLAGLADASSAPVDRRGLRAMLEMLAASAPADIRA